MFKKSIGLKPLPFLILEKNESCSPRSSFINQDSVPTVIETIPDIPVDTNYASGSSFSPKISASESFPQLDVGLYIGKPIDDITKKNLLLNPWMPPKNYDFPYSVHLMNEKTVKRKASFDHLNSFPAWLVFSDAKKGFFCKYCPFFVSSGCGGYQKNVKLSSLVSQPLTNFKKLKGKDGHLTKHNDHKYHKDAMVDGKNFLLTFDKKHLSVDNMLNAERLREIQKNRAFLLPIVKTTIFLGRQNIAFRGHRDDGELKIDEEISSNEGNFRAALRFRIESGDKDLEELLKSGRRATRISKTTVNLIIKCCERVILRHIIKDVQEARIYSIMFDETTDISLISQLSIILRYRKGDKICESFVKFLDLHAEDKAEENEIEPKMTGIKIGNIVINALKDLDLNLQNCVGITTDGCSTMVSEMRGAVRTIMQEAVNATYSPCANHILNLSLSKSIAVQAVRNAIGTLKEIIFFFKGSAKRHQILKRELGHGLHGLSDTRWIERHHGVSQFREALPKISNALSIVSKWKDMAVAAKANGFFSNLMNSSTLVAIFCFADVLSCTLPLSTFLQRKKIDLKCSQEAVDDVLKILEKKREKCDVKFASLMIEISGVAEELGTEIVVPRTACRQIHRDNHPGANAEDFFRRSIYIPLIDNIKEDLKARFPDDVKKLFRFFILFPTAAKEWNEDERNESIKILAEKYCFYFKESKTRIEDLLKCELELWYEKWSRDPNVGSRSASEFLTNCDEDLFPTIHGLLKIFVTLPISNASAERSFSTLRRLKTWLRSTMSQDRMTGLALLNIYYEFLLDPNEVIDEYASTGNRTDNFIL